MEKFLVLSGRINKNVLFIVSVLSASIFFIILGSVNLSAQGLYYDEVHQATASFSYQGEDQYRFAPLVIDGIPIMNMPYSGALKTALYGMYLKITDGSFGVISWRMVGILSVGLAIIIFGLLVKKQLKWFELLAFFFLLITDITVVLTSRHDWGPTALALSLRILLIGLWVRGELSEKISVANTFWMGCVVGISIFEKLSSAVLIIPLLLSIILSRKRRTAEHVLFSALGFLLGLTPLIIANLYSYYHFGFLITFQNTLTGQHHTLIDFVKIFKDYIALGAGEMVRDFILGNSQHAFNLIETIQISLAILAVLITGIVLHLKTERLRLSFVMLLNYLMIFIGVILLPQTTWVHHWIIGTPFQYMAFSLLITDWSGSRPRVKVIGSLFIVLFVIFRLTGLTALGQSLIRGDASRTWDPGLTRIGEFAESRSGEAIFIAADWGVANQMVCLTNGKPDLIYEMYRTDGGTGQLKDIEDTIRNSDRSEAYLVFIDPPVFTSSAVRDLILMEVAETLGPQWQATAVDEPVSNLGPVLVFKFERTPK